jgi:hypothetical protein
MYSTKDELKLNDRCSSIAINNNYIIITDGSYLRIYETTSLSEKLSQPKYTIRNENTIVNVKINNNRNSNFKLVLGICDMDYKINIFDIEQGLKQISNIDPGTCN